MLAEEIRATIGQSPLMADDVERVMAQVLPTARAHPSEVNQPCETCGFARSFQTKDPKLDAASFDASRPLQRVYESPGIVLVNEALAQFIREKKLSGVELGPMRFE